MTYSFAAVDYYDDGLVHAHEWSRATPPGGHHAEGRRESQGTARGSDRAKTETSREV